jgi:glutamine phosphoribosylpyrophosphate amidotransferase
MKFIAHVHSKVEIEADSATIAKLIADDHAAKSIQKEASKGAADIVGKYSVRIAEADVTVVRGAEEDAG